MRGREHPAILLPLAASLFAYGAGRGDWIMPAVILLLLIAGYFVGSPAWWRGWARTAIVMVPLTVAAYFYQQSFLTPGLSLYLFNAAMLATISVLMAWTLVLIWYWAQGKNRGPDLILAGFIMVVMCGNAPMQKIVRSSLVSGALVEMSGNAPERKLYVPAVALYFLCLAIYFKWEQVRAGKARAGRISDRLVDYLAYAVFLALSAGLGLGLIRTMAQSQSAMMSLAAEAVRLYEGEAGINFSDSMRLGSLSGFEDSQDPVMSLTGTGPIPDYLRCQVFNAYEKGAWRNKSLARAPLQSSGQDGGQLLVVVPAAQPRWNYRVDLVTALGEVLPLPQGATSVSAPVPLRYNPSSGLLAVPPDQHPMQYQIEGNDGPLPGNTVGDMALELAMPDALRAALTATAQKLTGAAATDREKAAAVVRYFSSYEYSLQPKPGMKGDQIENFVLAQRYGFCQDFASASVMLLRAAGVPARLVTGFMVQESVAGNADILIVRRRDAHAWVEFFDRAAGHWIKIDPTPLSAMNDALGIREPSRASLLMDRLRIRLRLLADAVRRVKLGDLIRSVKPKTLLAPAGALAGLIIAVMLYRRFKSLRFKFRGKSGTREKRRTAGAGAGALTQIYGAFLREIGKRGITAEECETGSEVLSRIKTAPDVAGLQLERCEDFIRAYTSARFQKAAPAPDQALSRLESILAELRAAP